MVPQDCRMVRMVVLLDSREGNRRRCTLCKVYSSYKMTVYSNTASGTGPL